MTKQHSVSLIVRIVFGFMFFYHGVVKFQAGIGNIAGYFESLGLAGSLAYVIAILEVIGGLFLMFGFGTKIVGALFAIIMVGAIFTAKLPLGLFGDGTYAGYELEIIYLVLGIYFVFADRFPLSVDQVIANKKA